MVHQIQQFCIIQKFNQSFRDCRHITVGGTFDLSWRGKQHEVLKCIFQWVCWILYNCLFQNFWLSWALLFGYSYCFTYEKQNLQFTYLNQNVPLFKPKSFLSLPQERQRISKERACKAMLEHIKIIPFAAPYILPSQSRLTVVVNI